MPSSEKGGILFSTCWSNCRQSDDNSISLKPLCLRVAKLSSVNPLDNRFSNHMVKGQGQTAGHCTYIIFIKRPTVSYDPFALKLPNLVQRIDVYMVKGQGQTADLWKNVCSMIWSFNLLIVF